MNEVGRTHVDLCVEKLRVNMLVKLAPRWSAKNVVFASFCVNEEEEGNKEKLDIFARHC